MSKTVFTALAAVVSLAAPALAVTPQLNVVGSYWAGASTNTSPYLGRSESVAYDPITQRLYVTNSDQNRLNILNVANPAAPTLLGFVDLAPYGGGPNSVAVKNGSVAVAVEATTKTDPGKVVFFNAAGTFVNQVAVGALPDMLTFTPDGSKILVANEGEPNSYNQPGSVDPEGSISIINTATYTVQTAGFSSFNAQAATLKAAGVRIFGPNASVAQDLEPEYISISADGTKAYVTLQEANALATVDIASATVTAIKSFGFKDHNTAGNGLDASDNNGSINITTLPVKGMYQPDAIATYQVNGQTYHITANEGDARDYTGFSEELRVNNAGYVLDPTVFPNAATLKQNANLGRLNVTSATGDTDGDLDIDEIHVFGARSFSIWSEDGTLIYDSGDDIEQIVAAALPTRFNASNDNNTFDNRSDNKGPEPEAVVYGEAWGRKLAFIGLERIGGVMMYDVSDPTNPIFLQYLNPRDFTKSPTSGLTDSGPEVIGFISALDSPNGIPLLYVANEISNTTTLYSIIPEPASLTLLGFGAAALLAKRRRV